MTRLPEYYSPWVTNLHDILVTPLCRRQKNLGRLGVEKCNTIAGLLTLVNMLSSQDMMIGAIPYLPEYFSKVFSSMVDSSGAVRQASHAFIVESLADNVITPFVQTLVAQRVMISNNNVCMDILPAKDQIFTSKIQWGEKCFG